MDKSQRQYFVENVEKLVKPLEVGTIHFVHGLNRMMPLAVQNKLNDISTKQFPIMGFVVEPYCSFLCYEIIDIKKANGFLPHGFSLIKTKVFESDLEAKYYAIFGSIRVHASAFWGARMEFYVIAEDNKTGLLTWVIVDYDTDTIGQDKKYGLREPNSSDTVVTTDFDGRIYVNFKNNTENRQLSYTINTENGRMGKLSERLWLEGNLSIVYGKELSGATPIPFGLIFDPNEVEQALDIPEEDIIIAANTWFTNLLSKEPTHVIVFPYAQHFLVSTEPSKAIHTRQALENAVISIDFNKVRPITASGFKYVIMGIVFVLSLIILVLVLILVM